MNTLIVKLLMSLATCVVVITLATGCEAPEYEEEDRYSVVPKNQQVLMPVTINYQP